MRTDFHQRIDQLSADLVDAAERADEMLGAAVEAFSRRDTALAEDVVAMDVDLNERYEAIQHEILNLIALQAPVAGDLRLLSAMIHVNLHIERMGDYAVGVARAYQRAADLPDAPELVAQLVELGELAREVGREGLDAFRRVDADAAMLVGEHDDQVDRLNIGVFHRLVRLASSDDRRLEWATHMILVARLLERYADHGVDIAEQAVFAATGSTVEMSSAEQ